MATPVSIETLLGHAGWLRTLARQLVDDDAEAEDAVQDAWAVALQRPPHHAGNARGWLGQVLRSVIVSRQRQDRARRRREEHARSGRTTAPPAEIVAADAEDLRMLVECVGQLAEPYRTTVLLRYFHGESPRAIAAREGVPASTIRSRLQRGLAKLRVELDRRHGGDRRKWAVALLPLVPRPKAWLPAATAAGAVALASATGILLATGSDPERTAPVSAASEVAAESEATPGRRVTVASERHPLSNPLPAADPAPADALVHGQVVGLGGDSVAGLELRFAAEHGDTTGILRSDAAGRFAWRPSEPSFVETTDPGLVTVLSGYARADGTDGELVVLVAPGSGLSGWVQDPAGNPLAEVTVSASLPEGFRPALGVPLDGSHSETWAVDTDVRGAFAFDALPAITDLRFTFRLRGWVSRTMDRAELEASGMVVLERRETTRLPGKGVELEAAMGGRVVDHEGQGLAGVRLWVTPTQASGDAPHAPRSGATDSDGSFRIDGLGTGDYRLVAVHSSTLARTEIPVIAGDAPIVVIDTRVAEEIRGRVVDMLGTPVEGVTVEAIRPLPDMARIRSAEGTLGDGRTSRPFAAQGLQIGFQAMGPRAVTDSEGRFALPPVAVDGVRLRILGASIAEAVVEPARAETGDVVVRRRTFLQVIASVSTLSGALLDEDGREIATYVDEGPLRRVYSRRFPLPGGRSEVLTVPDDATTLVLFDAKGEVARRPLSLRPGERNRLQL